MTTVATAGRTILFSGLTVAAARASLQIFPQGFLRSMSWGGIAAVLVAMTAALTLLPATLAWLGRRIEAGQMPWRRRRSAQALVEHGRWAEVARSVMRRPVAYVVSITVVLLALGAPFLGVSWGSVDERVLPEDAPSRIAAGKQAALFGGEQSTANAVVTWASQPEVRQIRRRAGPGRRCRRRPRTRPILGRRRIGHAGPGDLERQRPDRGVAADR